MSREIKFRAWLKNENKMAKVHSLHLNKKNIIVTYKTDYGAGGNCSVKEGDYELMQYTGIKDKNGVEIYEGDILCSPKGWLYDEMNGQIVWANNGYRFICTNYDVKWLLDSEWCRNLKVIGNIIENKDLL